MKFSKKFILILLFIFPISNSYGAMVTSVQNETFADNSSREINGIAFNEDGTKLFTSYHMLANPGEEAEATYKLSLIHI